ncbi:hypothetical protein KKA95_01580, partial [Patescibacteria group bacterium]|nr:hypothetical protein [Patescibacteria group bacterium]
MALRNEDLKNAILAKGLIEAKALEQLIEQSKAKNISLERLLSEKNVLSEDVLFQLAGEIYEVPTVKLEDVTINDSLLPIVPYTLASHQFVIPFEQDGKTLKVALADPTNYELLNFLEKKTGLEIKPYYSPQKDIQLALKAYNRDVNQKFAKLLEGATSEARE